MMNQIFQAVFIVAFLLSPTLVSAELPQKIGVALFEDVGASPSFSVQPESLQAFLVRNLKTEYGIHVLSLDPATKTVSIRSDPNTQLLPPSYRTGGWKGHGILRRKTDWREIGRKRRLTLLIEGIYEESEGRLRYAAQGLEPISGRVLFSCRAEGNSKDRFGVESQLASAIADKMKEIDVGQEVTKVREEIYRKRLLSEGLADSKEFLSIAQKNPTAEDHYENGYSLTRQYETTQDIKYLEGAAEEYRAALAIDPKHFRALNNMGTVMHRLQKYEDAIGYYLRVLEINPTYARAMENAALAYQSLHRPGEALKMWKKALEYEDRPEIHKTIEETIAKLEQAGQE